MQGHTEKLRTNDMSITFAGPIAMKQKALEAMHSLGFQYITDNQEDEGSIPWRESNYYNELMKNPPSVFLSGARYREGLTQVELAERTGIPRRHISEMENGKRPIGKHNARKLSEILNIDPRRLLTV